MKLKSLFEKIQNALISAGAKLEFGADGKISEGGETLRALDEFDLQIIATKKKETLPAPAENGERPVNPAYKEAKKYEGQGENSPWFVKWLSAFWKLPEVGLPNFKTIIGASFAWCGLFFAAMHSETGLSIVKGAAGAANWRKAGVEIVWQRDGIPQGAEVELDHDGNCDGKNNHITWADADCAPQDLIEMTKDAAGVWKPTKSPAVRKNVTWPGYGGNQGNMVKTSRYGVKEICTVRWPHEIKKPGPVTKSVGCLGPGQGGESTR